MLDELLILKKILRNSFAVTIFLFAVMRQALPGRWR